MNGWMFYKSYIEKKYDQEILTLYILFLSKNYNWCWEKQLYLNYMK